MLRQGIELRFPEGAVACDPFRRALHGFGLQAAPPHAAVFGRGDQSRALEHAQMLGKAGKGNVEGSGQLADARLAPGQSRQNSPAHRVGQRRKGGVKRAAGILNHMV